MKPVGLGSAKVGGFLRRGSDFGLAEVVAAMGHIVVVGSFALGSRFRNL